MEVKEGRDNCGVKGFHLDQVGGGANQVGRKDFRVDLDMVTWCSLRSCK